MPQDADQVERAPLPPHRHAAPSGPWPWMDLGSTIRPEQLSSEQPPVPEPCDHSSCKGACWEDYPRSRFPNWESDQTKRAKIDEAVASPEASRGSVLYIVDTDRNGIFHGRKPIQIARAEVEDFWNRYLLKKRDKDVKVRCLFVENMTGPVLQMLGARYNIEPFFFSSSLNWIPSRYQEDIRPKEGDHITITLPFLTVSPNPLSTIPKRVNTFRSIVSVGNVYSSEGPKHSSASLDSDTDDHRILLLDLLSVHFIRDSKSSTIISYHPRREQTENGHPKKLSQRIHLAGQSVYWQGLFSTSPDPTFILITYLWHALYAWDEALETLYQYVCWLESRVIKTSEMALTQELHIIRAHHLYHSELLTEFAKTVRFVLNTPNPAMDSESITEEVRLHSRNRIEAECRTLLSEIERLQKGRKSQDQRLKNVMNLVFSSVTIKDSRRMQLLTQAAVKDSAAMKQIAYLTMLFLPATFLATVFGMNIQEVTDGGRQTAHHYITGTLILTSVTIWGIMAFQSAEWTEKPEEATILHRIFWPYLLVRRILGRGQREGDEEEKRLERLSERGGVTKMDEV
ncbi:hypothetical protein PC9H_010609 [Pleurotus ostreatus]|uniref:Uncharacterized protein n=1 Tax=Pleurotus ostreatus TaxID=5322 RepID=A0A8H6ZPS7_PLEOS|nr:uncharacterized protein PC9H_010609 [Pleurotus ostreatus]KAF7422453.1 hypothetical protein PC9H_010609 [Pleurotus ostreatus]